MEPNVYILDKSSNSTTTSTKYLIDCNDKLSKSNYRTKDWFEIEEILFATNYDMKNKIILGILDKHKKCVAKIGESNTIEKEFLISKIIKHQNVIKTYCFFKCLDDYTSINKNSKYLCNGSGDKMKILLSEYCPLGNMRDFNFIKHPNAFYSCLSQVILTMIDLYSNYNFFFNDAHSGNCLIKKTTKETINYLIDNKYYEIKTHGFKIVLLDFENSFIFNVRQNASDTVIKDIHRFVNDFLFTNTQVKITNAEYLQTFKTINISKLLENIDKIEFEKKIDLTGLSITELIKLRNETL